MRSTSPRAARGPLVAHLVLAALAALQPTVASAQVEKGDVEIRVVGASSSVGVGDNAGDLSFSLTGSAGYFFTRHHEVGGIIGPSVFRSREQHFGNFVIPADTHFGLELGAFYRYNFADKDEKGFPFVGADIESLDVTENGDELTFVRPQVGYKYFVKRNVAIEGSIGWDANVKRPEASSIGTRVGLVFVF